jgi:hypothetical protein
MEIRSEGAHELEIASASKHYKNFRLILAINYIINDDDQNVIVDKLISDCCWCKYATKYFDITSDNIVDVRGCLVTVLLRSRLLNLYARKNFQIIYLSVYFFMLLGYWEKKNYVKLVIWNKFILNLFVTFSDLAFPLFLMLLFGYREKSLEDVENCGYILTLSYGL